MSAKKVLLVDDDREFIEANKLVLEGSGYEVFTAYDGEGGKKKALEVKPHVIVLDVMMETNEAGFEVARWLRSEEATAKIPIIMLTGINQEFPLNFDKDEVWLPVDEFFEKPVEPEKLIEALKDKAPVE